MLKTTVKDINEVKEEHRGLYTKLADGSYALNIKIEGFEPVAGLKAKNEELLGKMKASKDEATRLQAEANARTEKDLLAKNEFEKVLATRQLEFDAKAKEADAQIQSLKASIKAATIDTSLMDVATKLFGKDADIMKPIIAARFDAIEDGAGFKIQIKDSIGNPSAMTTDQLMEEFKKDERLQKFIVGRESSGGGVPGSNNGAGPGTDAEWDQYFDRKSPQFSLTKQADLQEKDAEMYKRISSKYEEDLYSRSNLNMSNIIRGKNSR